MAEMKTTANTADVSQFVAGIEDGQKRADSEALVRLMQEVTGEPAVMWGSSIVGFGRYHYRYASGREGDSMILGFSPRKQNLTIYLPGYLEQHRALFEQLGKHSTGKGCLYIKRLSDVDFDALRRLLASAVERHRQDSTVE
jgi:hypothetical protein